MLGQWWGSVLNASDKAKRCLKLCVTLLTLLATAHNDDGMDKLQKL
jgi:hypothetical protein